MKKVFYVLMSALLVIGLAVSCNADVSQKDELVILKFGTGDSATKGLTATPAAFKADDYYWKYKATKADSTGLTSGQTSETWIKDASFKGLNYEIPGFSQGTWNFELYAYTDTSATNLVYSGSANGVTIKKESHIVKVQVFPQAEGNGKLEISENVCIVPKTGTVTQTDFVKWVQIDDDGFKTQLAYENITAGVHTVTVQFINNGIVCATGSVKATVYPGLTTTIAGDLKEIITPVKFEGESTSIVNEDAYSESFDEDSLSALSGSVKVQYKKPEATSASDKSTVISSEVPKEAAEAYLTAKTAEVSGILPTTTTDEQILSREDKMVLTMSVNTIGKTTTTVEYEISLMSELTTTYSIMEGEKQIKAGEIVTSNKVENLTKFASTVLTIGSGLSDVKVTHSGVLMSEKDSLTEYNAVTTPEGTNDPGCYYYDSTEGTLYLKSTSFSPFAISYTKQEEPIAKVGTKYYMTIQEAIDSITGTTETTITLLHDVIDGAAFGFEDGVENYGKNIVLDLGGFTYTFLTPAVGSSGTRNQAIHLIGGNTLKIKNGKLAVSSASEVITRMIQNYCNLTLEDVIVDCTYVKSDYNNSMCRGVLTVKGNTQFIASKSDAIIFDVDGVYCDDHDCTVTVTFDNNFTGSVTGLVEYVPNKEEGHTSAFTYKGKNLSTNKKVLYSYVGDMFKTKLALVDGQEQYSIEDLETAAEHASSIKLLQDIDLTGSGGSEQIIVLHDCTLDLNGYTLNGSIWSGSYSADEPGTKLTIIDSSANQTGTIHSRLRLGDYNALIQRESVMSYKNSVIINSGNFVSNHLAVTCQVQGVINEEGVIINGGRFAGSDELINFDPSVTEPIGNCLQTVIGKVTINGGEFTAAKRGSVIIAESGDSKQNTVVTINGGTFKGYCMFDFGKDHSSKTIVNVYGGNFTVVTGGEIKGTNFAYDNYTKGTLENNEMFELNIMGGSFNYDPTPYVPTGYLATENNGIWTVSKTN